MAVPKHCNKCDRDLPLTVEFWKPNRSTKTGWSLTMCRECTNSYYRDYAKNNPEWRQEKEKKYRERNPEKYKDKQDRHHLKQKLEGKNKYCNRNVERCREYDRKRRAENPARREWDKKRWEKRRLNGYNEQQRKRYKLNPLYWILKTNRRRSMKLNAKGFNTIQQFNDKYAYYGFRCYYCNQEFSLQDITMDHRIPLIKGGSNWISNIVPACRSCNSQKGAKSEKEYKIWLSKSCVSKVVMPSGRS